MKTKLAGLLVGISLFTTAQQANADVVAPKGCHFEVQVKYVTYRHSYWQTFSGPNKSLDDAERTYSILKRFALIDQLAFRLGWSGGPFPVDVRAVMICNSDNEFKSDRVYVIDSTE